MKKSMIFLMVFVLLISSVFAQTSWIRHGNDGVNTAGGLNDLLFASGYVNGTLNMTEISEARTNHFLPIVFPPLDDQALTFNYIYAFSSNAITLYDASDFTLISSTTINSSYTICGQPQLINVDSDSEVEMLIPITNGTENYVNLYEVNNNVDLEHVKSYALPDTSTCAIATGFPVNNDFFASVSTANVRTTSIATGITVSTAHSLTYASSGMIDTSFDSGDLSRPVLVNDIDKDGDIEIVIASSTTTAGRIKIYDEFLTEESDSGSITHAVSTAFDVVTVNVAQVGTPTGAKELVLRVYEGRTGLTKGDRGYSYLLDSSGSLLDSQGSSLQGMTNLVVGDVNFDGLNEFCYIQNHDLLKCRDSTFAEIVSVTVSSEEGHYIAMGEYDQDTTYMDIIRNDGIYRINNSASVEIVFNMSETAKVQTFYPVSLVTQTAFQKDILFIESTKLTSFIGSGTSAVCGDLVCSFFETATTCPVDCLVIINPLENLGTGSSCTNSSACASDKCVQNVCTLKAYTEACASDSECLSGDCDVNLLCTKPSYFQQLDSAKDVVVGDDTNSNDFVSIMILIGISVLIIVTLAKHNAPKEGMFLAGVFIVVGSVLLMVFGWLSLVFGLIILFSTIVLLLFSLYIATQGGG